MNDVRWDLDSLLSRHGGTTVDVLLERAGRYAAAVAKAEGMLASLDAPALARLMRAVAELHELVGRAHSYAVLRVAADTGDSAGHALLRHVEDRVAALAATIGFLEVEWVALPEERAEEFLAAPELAFVRRHLALLRRWREHMLPLREEAILIEAAAPAVAAWARVAEESIAAVRVGPARLSLDEAFALLTSSERSTRRAAAYDITAALAPELHVRAHALAALVDYEQTESRLRGFRHWFERHCVEHDTSAAMVETLVDTVRARDDLPHRWYAQKAAMLGLEKLADYDRMAPIVEAASDVDWAEGVALVLDALAALSPDLGREAHRVFGEHRIDAAVTEGKQCGALCAPTVPSGSSYVLLNWAGRRRDVLILAHELGHAIHAALGASQGVFHHEPGLPLKETAAIFAETAVLEWLLESMHDRELRLALRAEALDSVMANVFRPIAIHRFEDAVHAARAEGSDLSAASIGRLWNATQAELLGDAVELTDGYSSWWSFVPQLYANAGSFYTYAYAHLLALALHQQRNADPAEFAERYVRMLRAGGALAPEELVALVGCDLRDPALWTTGLTAIERHLAELERDAAALRAPCR